MGAGRLSYSQVRAISRIVEPDEHALVDDLVEAARHGTVAQLEVLVRGLRTVDDNETPTGPAEYLTRSWTADSRWRLAARLDRDAPSSRSVSIPQISPSTHSSCQSCASAQTPQVRANPPYHLMYAPPYPAPYYAI